MAKYFVVYCFIFIAGWNAVLAEDSQVNNDYSEYNRNARHLHKRRRCQYDYCGGGFGGFQGGYYQGNQYPYPPINIGISQSQASASGPGGYGGYNPNYNQYYNQYNNGYPGYQNNGFGPYNRPPYYGNGYGPQNNQFNGNYLLANTGNGYGLAPLGDRYDDQYEGDEDARSASKKD